jgi:asparagine synthase (glutamine-hydrolysing)
MCGFAGFIDFKGERGRQEELLAELRPMTDSLVHRGPDDSDYWADHSSGVALGHRRLSIIDLSPAGRQPMASPCGRYRIVFNGEIYNFKVLRPELERSGHRFRGHSDTEVLLAGCAQWGVEGALKRSVGMFAFALWDGYSRSLTIARDRMGEKPLYYGWVGARFVFASEVRALRHAVGWQGELSPQATTLFLRYGYVPTPYSIYRGIYKLPPATYLTIETHTGTQQVISPQPRWGRSNELAPIQYWSVREVAEHGLANPVTDEREAIETLETLLGESVNQQMIADVPLGAFLSAGVDSSSVVALMQRHSQRPVKTFTVGFTEKAFDEAVHARAISQHLGTDHTEMYLSAADSLGRIPTLSRVYDEPFADASQLPTLLLSEVVRRHVTVCLTGDGGDELFGGYNRYWWSERLWSLLHLWPQTFRRGVASAISSVPPGIWNIASKAGSRLMPASAQSPQSTAAEKVAKIADAMASRDITHLYNNLVSYWKQPNAIVPNVVEPASVICAENRLEGASSEVQNMQYWDQTGYLSDDNLVKVDRASMAASLETRVPLLDHRIVEFSWRLPTSMKFRDGSGKWLLRQVLYRHVPRELIDRPKMGFSVPIGKWIRSELRDWAESLLSIDALRATGLLDEAPIRRAWADHIAGRRNLQAPLWAVLMLQSWLSTSRASAS